MSDLTPEFRRMIGLDPEVDEVRSSAQNVDQGAPPAEPCPECMTYWISGCTEGISIGREQAESELAAIQRAAVASVRAVSEWPVRDADADRAAAARREARWSK